MMQTMTEWVLDSKFLLAEREAAKALVHARKELESARAKLAKFNELAAEPHLPCARRSPRRWSAIRSRAARVPSLRSSTA